MNKTRNGIENMQLQIYFLQLNTLNVTIYLSFTVFDDVTFIEDAVIPMMGPLTT